MGLRDRFVRQLDGALETVLHSVDYARHLVLGNRVRGDMPWIREGAPPVVLVHGFLGTRGAMLPLTRRFQADGRAVFKYGYNFNLASVESSARDLAAQVRTISEELGVPRVDMVGYSMGGLLGLHMLKFLEGERWIRRLAMLGAPLRGSWLGFAGVATLGAVSPAVWQLLPGSSLLRMLRESPLPPNVRVSQIHGDTDAFCPLPPRMTGVLPSDYHVLPGGHSSLIVAPNFYEVTRRFLVPEAVLRPSLASQEIERCPAIEVDRLATAAESPNFVVEGKAIANAFACG